MNLSAITARRKVTGAVIASLLGGVAAATIAAPAAVAEPQGCSAADVAGTASSTLGAARGYLNDHPAANQVVTAAFNQPRGQAATDLRNYFTANPGEYYDLKGILSPIGDKQRQCNVTVLPADLQSAYDEFIAG
ncbi:MAG: heme-binding protein [Mycobacterium sp.]